jgi:hypothetical protein
VRTQSVRRDSVRLAVAFGVLVVAGAAALNYPLYRPGATFFPAVAPVAALLALLVAVVRRDRVQLSIAALQACLAFPAILLLGASAAYVANGVLDRGPPTAIPYEVGEIRDGRNGRVAWLVPTREVTGAPRLPVDADRVGGAAAVRGKPVLVRVRPGAFGYPWIVGYETPTH